MTVKNILEATGGTNLKAYVCGRTYQLKDDDLLTIIGIDCLILDNEHI